MTPAERWRRVQDLCEQLDGIPDAEAEARLGQLERDADVRRETRDVLSALRAEAAYSAPVGRAPLVVPPTVVGGVRIFERLGAGGSGEVFRGVRTVHGTDQVVAVKRFHAHRVDAADLERIAREQRMLAALTHPDIVRLLDAGVGDDGRPFLVMELVDGVPITRYADAERLTVRRRLVLFLAVCQAVQSAHQHLIVHLDLKPGNILVTADGRPKLLDFGTAKLADPIAGFTRTEPLTLQYASPERLRGEAVSVACDVYSLGLILCELLSGAWPFRRQDSIVAIAERASGAVDLVPLSRVVTDEASERRATTADRLRAGLRGDLEAIAAKALRHDPADRYASVLELTEDIRRHLDGEPVRARPPGVTYLLGKFLRRHMWQTASVLLLLVGLAVAAAYSAVQAREARRAAARAEAQNQFLSSVFTLAGNDATSGPEMTVRQLLALADTRVTPLLSDLPDVAGDVERTLARGFIAQGAWAEAETLLERARARAAATGDVPRESATLAHQSYLAYVQNRAEEAVSDARAALALWTKHPSRFEPDLAASMLAIAGTTLAFVQPASAEPREHFQTCLAMTRDRSRPANLANRSSCLFGLAAVQVNADERFAEAETLLDEAVALQRTDPTMQHTLVLSLQLMGIVKRVTGRFVEDEAAQREAHEIIAARQGPDSTAALWQRAVWATSLVGAGRAVDGYRESMSVLEKARALYPTRGTNLLWTPLSAASTAACYLEMDNECEALTREALETLGPDPPANDARARTTRGLLGLVLARRGRVDEARPMIQAAVDGTLASKRTSIFMPRWQAALADTGR